MKQGKTLTELAAEVERQANLKRDFIADTRELVMSRPASDSYSLKVNGHGDFTVTNHTHHQIAQRLGIPQKYYDRMMSENPQLLSQNVNGWFQAQPERRMVRTLDGRARAFLSDRYRPLDNYDLSEAVLPVLLESPQIKIESTEVTESRLYIKALFPRIETEVKAGDPVQSGIVITNSEIGLSALRIEPLIFRLVCLNGMIAADHSVRKYHVGRASDEGDLAFEIYRDETLRQDDRAFWMKVQDAVRAAADQSKFEVIVQRMRETTKKKIGDDPVRAVEVLQNKFQLSEAEKGGILRHLIEGADLSQYGLLNAVTRYSQDVQDYDRATDLERLGGRVVELSRSDWQEISEAA